MSVLIVLLMSYICVVIRKNRNMGAATNRKLNNANAFLFLM